MRVERNTLVTTAPSTGGRQGAIRPFDAANALIADNTAIGPWRAGVSATRLACGNPFVGNHLQGNPGNLGLVFDVTSGANTYAGDRIVVVDNGAFDCNGDGVNDPNIISGPGMARHGLGMGVSEAAGGAPHTVHGIVVK